MLSAAIATTFVVLSLVTSATARPEFVARLPNGANVPGVDALGHINPAGGGARNPFGLDFDAAGRKWTAALCKKDSDGDGQTNGQELGDPCCAFVVDSNAKVLWTTGVSHPGDKTKMSDASLWASVSCASASSNTTAPGSNSTSGGAAATAGNDDSNGMGSVPTPSPTKSAAPRSSVVCTATALVIGAVLTLALA